MSKKLSLLALVALSLVLSLTSVVPAFAQAPKTFLILNAYHEDEPWGNATMTPVLQHLSQIDYVNSEVAYLNSAIVDSQEVYDEICDNVFGDFTASNPSYVMLVGNFGVNLFERIKREWGDIPILLVSRLNVAGSIEDYFINNNDETSLNDKVQLSSLRKLYNFTAITVPDCIEGNVDMMVKMIPDMDTLVFMSDKVLVNKVAAQNINTYLLGKYPNISFRWLKADADAQAELRHYIFDRDLRTGLLLSSWVYDVPGTRGFPVQTTKDLRHMSASVNPIFTLRDTYMTYGTVGGMFSDSNLIHDEILKIVDEMISGKSMRSIPFFTPDNSITHINYRSLKNYHLSEKNCPKDAIFINKPLSIWEQHRAALISFFLTVLFIILILVFRTSSQRKQISVLKRHNDFVKNMPVPYAQVSTIFDEKGFLRSYEILATNTAYGKGVMEKKLPKDFMRYFPEEFVENNVRNMVAADCPYVCTYNFKDYGSIFDFILSCIQVKKMPQGRTEYIIDVFLFDLTDRHMMEENLKKSSNALGIAMNVGNIIPYHWNNLTNRINFSTYKGYFRNYADKDNIDMEFEQFLTLIYPEDVHIIRELKADLEAGRIKEFVIQYRTLNNDSEQGFEWSENHGAVIEESEDGKVVKVSGCMQLITERKKQEMAMQLALDKASESDRLKSAFLANMSHEIRTPLNAIVGFSNLLAKEKDESARANLVQMINKNNDLLLTLINDVLDLAKIESNTVDIIPSICDINDLMESLGKTMSIRIPDGVYLNIMHYCGTCVVLVDPSRLSQILINLLTNACKFTKKGSITLGYEIREDEGTLYFYVRDTGIGIAKEDLGRIFTQFVKLNNFVQGTGLGLAICKNLVEHMGGEIGVESRGVGKGSTFWFTLPYKPVELHDNENDRSVNNFADSTLALSEESDTEHTKLNIMVAEDNDSNYWLLEQLLKDKFNLVNAKNGADAVEYFKANSPDIIIMDINMPVMDGYEAVAEIRKISETVPIIAVTAYAFASDRIRILNSGFDAYVSKPISEDAILEAINHVLNK